MAQGLGGASGGPLALRPQVRPSLLPRRRPKGRSARHGRVSHGRPRAEVLQPFSPPALRHPVRGSGSLPAGPEPVRPFLARGPAQDRERGPHGRLRPKDRRHHAGRPASRRGDERQVHRGCPGRRPGALSRHALAPGGRLPSPRILRRPARSRRLSHGQDHRAQRGLRLDRRPDDGLPQGLPRPRDPGCSRAHRNRRVRAGRPRPRSCPDPGQDLRPRPGRRPDGPVARGHARTGRQAPRPLWPRAKTR